MFLKLTQEGMTPCQRKKASEMRKEVPTQQCFQMDPFLSSSSALVRMLGPTCLHVKCLNVFLWTRSESAPGILHLLDLSLFYLDIQQ